MEINVLNNNNGVAVLPDAGALDDFEGLGLNDASPEYRTDETDAEESDAARSPQSLDGVLGGLNNGGGGDETNSTGQGDSAASEIVDVKAPIDEQETVQFPDPIEIEVSHFSSMKNQSSYFSSLHCIVYNY